MSGQVRGEEFRFPVEIGWDERKRATARVAGSCLPVTIIAMADRAQLPLRALAVHTATQIHSPALARS